MQTVVMMRYHPANYTAVELLGREENETLDVQMGDIVNERPSGSHGARYSKWRYRQWSLQRPTFHW